MIAANLIREVRTAGIHLTLDGSALVCDAPATVQADRLLERIRQHKADVLATLIPPARTASEPGWLLCPVCPTEVRQDQTHCGSCGARMQSRTRRLAKGRHE